MEQIDNQIPGYRRLIIIRATEGQVKVAMEDDFHCFDVTLKYADGQVTSVIGNAGRIPWSTCDEALDHLKLYCALPVPPDMPELRTQIDSTQQCTHLGDLANLAYSYAGREAELQYEVLIEDNPEGDYLVGKVAKNGRMVWHWVVDSNKEIQSPKALSGINLKAIPAWAAENLSQEEAEAAFILRRAYHIARGRRKSYREGKITLASELNMPPTCHTFRPENAVRGRSLNSFHDFTGHQDQLLEHVERVVELES